jgi:hypothetical protein
MSMHASILAVGRFRKEFAEAGYYEFSADHYKGVPEGTIISTELGHINTTPASRELADLLGADLNEVATHHLKNEVVSRLTAAELYAANVAQAMNESPEGLVEALKAFASANYHLFLRTS